MRDSRDEAAVAVLERLAEWDIPHATEPVWFNMLVTWRLILAEVRDGGFALASCFFCSVMRPKLEVSRCPVCEALVGPAGRRRFARPKVCGVTVPDGGFSPEERDRVAAKVSESIKVQAAEILGRLTASTNKQVPEN